MRTCILLLSLSLACGDDTEAPAEETATGDESTPDEPTHDETPQTANAVHDTPTQDETANAVHATPTREETANAVRAARAAAEDAEDAAATAEARLDEVAAYLTYAEAHPSEGECLPEPREDGRAETAANPRWSARHEAKRLLRCAGDEGDPARIATLRERIDALAERAAAWCAARDQRPMEGNLAMIGTMGGACGPADAISRVLGIEVESAFGGDVFDGVEGDVFDGLEGITTD